MFKLTRTEKAQTIAALIKICIASINENEKLNEKLTTQTKLEHNNKEVQTLISLKLNMSLPFFLVSMSPGKTSCNLVNF